MGLFYRADTEHGLTDAQIRQALIRSLEGRQPKKVLLIPPDYSRYYSKAGFISNTYYRMLTDMGCHVDVLPALGSHIPMTREQAADMFSEIPFERFIVHNWRTDVVKIGEVPGAFLSEVSEGLWTEPIGVEVNKLLMDPSYDLILSVGQVVPHEVVGMANHAKNIFVGIGGDDIINKSHMLGGVYGIQRMMGKDHSPVRKLFDYALEHFLSDRPIVFVLTVCTAPDDITRTHGLFIGDTRKVLEEAIVLSQQKNIDFVDKSIKKCVVYLPPHEFHTTWVGNKSIYRTCMAIADGGELLILAPGVKQFGEDEQIDAFLRKYGYCGRKIMEQYDENPELRENLAAVGHLLHGATDGRFKVTYAVKKSFREELAGAGVDTVDYDETITRYDPKKLRNGFNTLPDGEEIFFVPNPALGLWIDRSRFYGSAL